MDKDELDQKIWAHHQSTKSGWRATNRLHNYLRMKSKSYHNWHTKPFAPFLHYSLAILIVALFFFFMAAAITIYGFEKYITWLEGVI